ncbi:MAG TPA: hypothetical protein VJI12_01225 [archaeon]|nr:hypothetical protein [archaeon]
MKSHDRIRKILDESPYGLTPDEVAKRAGLNEKSAQTMLDDLARDDRAKKTRAGATIFYRSAKLIAVLLFIIPLVHAQNMTSTSYFLETVLDSAGGAVSGSSSLIASIGQVSGRRSSDSFELCAGFLCSFYDVINRGRVALMLSFNISGTEGDQAFVDSYQDPGVYNAEELLNYYACVEDPTQTDNPVLGIIHSGTYLGYVKAVPAQSYTIKVSEDIPGNKFIIPVTSGGCTILNTRMPQIAQYGTILQPFVIVAEIANAIELALNYNAFDLTGSFDRGGQFKLIIEKNLTNERQIIIKPE